MAKIIVESWSNERYNQKFSFEKAWSGDPGSGLLDAAGSELAAFRLFLWVGVKVLLTNPAGFAVELLLKVEKR